MRIQFGANHQSQVGAKSHVGRQEPGARHFGCDAATGNARRLDHSSDKGRDGFAIVEDDLKSPANGFSIRPPCLGQGARNHDADADVARRSRQVACEDAEALEFEPVGGDGTHTSHPARVGARLSNPPGLTQPTSERSGIAFLRESDSLHSPKDSGCTRPPLIDFFVQGIGGVE